MKKSILAIILPIAILVGLTGCSQQVKLETGIVNSSTIKSCAYDITLATTTTGIKSTNIDAAALSVLNSGKVSLNFNGKMLNKEDKTKISSNVKASAAGVSFEAPMYYDGSNTKADFEMIVGVPEILKSMLGDQFANTTNLHFASKDLDSYLKTNSSAEEYKNFQSTMTNMFNGKSSKTSQVSKDMLETFNSYLDKNEKKVETFAKLDDKKSSKNGVYTIKFTKEDIKAIVSNYIGNEKYFANYKAAVKEAQDVSTVGSAEKVKAADLGDAPTLLAKVNKAIDTNKTVNIVSVFTIEDKLITKTNIKLNIVNDNMNNTTEIDSKLSEINKVTSITPPATNAENTLDIMKYITSQIK
ncbi:hypothetical protein [Clostridium lacusfryxellense]|uniref:hypothetical protein n=1 Tax=Clostridium lacusfryxellense TaxID=205328 RepID=UPI001C0B109C|nr:hypothetical protein [Clostridium lacusfryxellense]MBU3110949.1 hypothetical protein [Clostridium lacusfryxellense]